MLSWLQVMQIVIKNNLVLAESEMTRGKGTRSISSLLHAVYPLRISHRMLSRRRRQHVLQGSVSPLRKSWLGLLLPNGTNLMQNGEGSYKAELYKELLKPMSI